MTMKNNILLTGAGFSANFGAPLASEVSDRIFNHSKIQENSNLRELFVNEFDYEATYQKVIESHNIAYKDKVLLSDVVFDVFKNIDDQYRRNRTINQTYGDLFIKLLYRFASDSLGSGYIFTLNQDILVERRSTFYLEKSITIPAMMSKGLGKRWEDDFTINDISQVPKDMGEEIQNYNRHLSTYKYNLSYIKLHGSFDWKDQDGYLMVTGSNKFKTIEKSELLNFYYTLFIKQLAQENVKLMIIGYGFNDTHINKAIADSKAELYIINPNNREAFTDNLRNKLEGQKIIDRIRAYYRNNLSELFPNDCSEPHINYNKIYEDFFEHDFY